MMENIAHGGPGPNAIGPFTIFTWGNGAALEAAAKVRDKYGDVYIDLDRRQAFGIDGCTAQSKDGAVVIEDRYARSDLLVVMSDGRRQSVAIKDRKAATRP
ncbi:MAG: hypothetical protein IT435_12170 [Phycisphaerales bacterium]|nr:hypothetical protein [Phycisphaerales bacterium]